MTIAAPGAAGTTQLVLPCRYEYTVVQSTNSLGGSRVQGKYTPMDCQNFCDMEPMCVGFDMDFIGIPARLVNAVAKHDLKSPISCEQ